MTGHPHTPPPTFVPIMPADVAGPTKDEHDFARIEPVAMSRIHHGASSVAAPLAARSRPMPWVLVMAAALLLLALSIASLWWSRDAAPVTVQAPAPPAAAPAPPPAAPSASVSESRPDPQATEAALAQRQAIDALAQRYAEARNGIDTRGLSGWDAAAARALDERAEAARGAMREHDFSTAEQHWQAALADIASLQQRADALLSAALRDGATALQGGDGDAAEAAFSRALRIDPDNAEALAGNRKAANLAPLRASRTRAEIATRRGDFAAAEAAYREVLAIDPNDAQAQRGLAQARAGQAGSQFDALMSSGYAALQAGRFDAAEQAFGQAERLRAGASAARDGRLQVQLAREQKHIADLRAEAELAERSERWAQAQILYEQLVAGDGGLAFARDGRARSAERAALDARLQAHLAHPERLSEASVRKDAAAALAAAAQVNPAGEKLADQVARLQGLVAAASTPVDLVLHSDGRTQILLYRVGDLGQFAERRLQLLPGTYTAIGRCAGYRDVRVQFTVMSGMSPVPPIRCEERI